MINPVLVFTFEFHFLLPNPGDGNQSTMSMREQLNFTYACSFIMRHSTTVYATYMPCKLFIYVCLYAQYMHGVYAVCVYESCCICGARMMHICAPML